MAEFGRGGFDDQLAVHHDSNPGAEAFNQVHHVRREDNRCSPRRVLLEKSPDQPGADGIDPFEGLVEEEDRRGMDDGRGQREFFRMPRE